MTRSDYQIIASALLKADVKLQVMEPGASESLTEFKSRVHKMYVESMAETLYANNNRFNYDKFCDSTIVSNVERLINNSR